MPIGNRKLKSNYPRFWVHSKHEGLFVAGKQKSKLPPLEILKWLFRYDIETGKLFRIRESNGRLCEPEREIVAVDGSGYFHASITDSKGLAKKYKVHQLIYFIVSEIEPLSIVDHRDGNPLNNRFSNLRLATESVNQRNKMMQKNNTSGLCGVSWNKTKGKWVAHAYDLTGRRKHLGYFDEKEAAAHVVSEHYANPENSYSERHGLNASI